MRLLTWILAMMLLGACATQTQDSSEFSNADSGLLAYAPRDLCATLELVAIEDHELGLAAFSLDGDPPQRQASAIRMRYLLEWISTTRTPDDLDRDSVTDLRRAIRDIQEFDESMDGIRDWTDEQRISAQAAVSHAHGPCGVSFEANGFLCFHEVISCP